MNRSTPDTPVAERGPQQTRSRWVSVGSGAERAVALALFVLLAAYPVRAVLFDGSVSVVVKLLWIAALAVASVRPRWSPLVLVSVAPLLPLAPYLWSAIPLGIVQLLVFSQALPLLLRVAAGRCRLVHDAVFALLLLMLLVALASVADGYAGQRVGFYSNTEFVQELHRHLSGFIFSAPSQEMGNRLVSFFALLSGALAYLLLRANTVADRALVGRVLRALVIAAAVVAGLGVLQFATGFGLRPMWLRFDPKIVRINSTYTDPNALAAYFVLVIPLAAALAAASDERRGRLKWLAALALLCTALVMTAGRMAYVAAAIALAAVAAQAIRQGLDRADPWPLVRRAFRRSFIRAVALGAAALVAGTVIGTTWDVRHADQTSYLHTVLYTLNLRQPFDAILKRRLAMWRAAGLLIGDAPVFGIGQGMMLRRFNWYSGRVEGLAPGERLTAHNTFLNVTAELGFVGLAVWLTLIAVVGVAACRPDPPGTARRTRWTRIGYASALLGYALTMLTGDRLILPEDLVMMGAVTALALASCPSVPALSGRLRGVACVAVLLLVASWPARAVITARSVPVEGLTLGLYGPETDDLGRPFQWTGPRAMFHVPGSATVFSLQLRSLAPFPQRVRVSLDGKLADELALSDHEWHSIRYVLPKPSRRHRPHRVTLEIDPTFRRPGGGGFGVMLRR